MIANRPAFAYTLGHASHAFELFAFRAWIVAFLVFAAILSGADASRAEIGTYVAIYSVVGMATSILGAQVALYTNRSHTITIIMAILFLSGTALGFLAGMPFLIVVAAAGVYSAFRGEATILWRLDSGLGNHSHRFTDGDHRDANRDGARIRID